MTLDATKDELSTTEHAKEVLKHIEPAKAHRQILFVEDDLSQKPLWLSLIKSMDANAYVEWTTTEESAERFIKQKLLAGTRYDLIIADVFLSGRRTGIDLWKRYGKHGCQFVLISGAPPQTIQEMFAEIDEVPVYLQKPIQLPDCKEVLKKLF